MNRLITWMAKNDTAVNVILFIVILGGVISALSIKQEVFPDIEFDKISVDISYPGSSPKENEASLCLPLETAISNKNGVEEIQCSAYENTAKLNIDVEEGYNTNNLINEVKTYVDGITNLPKKSEKPQINKLIRKRQLMSLVISGATPSQTIFKNAEKIRNQLLEIPGVSDVDLPDLPKQELVIEILPEKLLQHKLNLTEIAQRIKRASLDLPGGSIQTKNQSILLKTQERRTTVDEIKKTIIATNKNGSRLRLEEISTISKKYVISDSFAIFDGQPSLKINIFQAEKSTPQGLSENIKAYVQDINAKLQKPLKVSVWSDRSEYFTSRFNLLLKNSILGIILVLIALSLFLNIRLAFWSALGMFASFVGTMMFLPHFGISINMLSMFAFILVLGIVVDDAIIVGERIYQKREEGLGPLEASIQGCKEMAVPVAFSIISTVLAFLPLIFTKGHMGKFLYAIPVIVVTILIFSLLESIFLLPCHLKSIKLESSKSFLSKIHSKTDHALKKFISTKYRKILVLSLRNKWLTISIAISIFILSISLVVSGKIGIRFFPAIERNEITINFELPPGYPKDKAINIVKEIENSGLKTIKKIDKLHNNKESDLRHIYSRMKNSDSSRGSTAVEIKALIKSSEKRKIALEEFTNNWRKNIPDIAEISKLEINSHWGHWGSDIHINAGHNDSKQLTKIVKTIKSDISKFKNVIEIKDSEPVGKKEFSFKLTAEALSLGLTPETFAEELRSVFHGLIIDRFNQERNEISTRLIFPSKYREKQSLIEDLLIKTPLGGMIPLSQAVTIKELPGPGVITRINQRRVVSITANVDKTQQEPRSIIQEIKQSMLPAWQIKYPGIYVSFEGAEKQRRTSTNSLILNFIYALLAIFALLAILFKSYVQPFIVMMAIPFGLVGTILGHGLMGYPLSFLSFFGVVGLSGVVVNDSLILMNTINNHKKKNLSLISSILKASYSRFRPIFLTSLTTFVGLVPILLEKSRQAQFLIPMAISLGVGIVFATLITLILIPVLTLLFINPKNSPF